MHEITEKTKYSWPILVAILGSYGFVLAVSFKTDASADSIKELKADQRVMQEISSDVKVIKYKLEVIEKRIGQ